MTSYFTDSLKPSNSVLITYIVLANIAVPFNFICISAIAKKRRKIKSFEILLIHLMLTDMIVAGTALLLAVALLYDLKEIQQYEFSIIAHIFVGTSYQMTLVILFMSINRLSAVKYPLQHRLWMTRKKTLTASLLMWFVFVVFLSVTLVAHYLEKRRGNPFAIPDAQRILFIAIACSFAASFIVINIETLRLILRSNTILQGITNNTAPTRPRDKGLLLTTTMMMICFCICTTPRVYQFARKKGEIGTVAALLANTLMNPILYFVIAEVKHQSCKASRRGRAPIDT